MANTLDNAGIQGAVAATPPLYTKEALVASDAEKSSANATEQKSDVPRQEVDVSSVAGAYAIKQSIKETNHETAQAVRQLDDARTVIDKMRENLSRIVKMYPPYAKDDAARAQFMSSVVGLRQVTEQLTIPPAYSKLLSSVTSAPGVQDVNASDSQVADALAQLDKVSNALAAESRKLFDSTDAVFSTNIGGEQGAQQQSQKVGGELGASGSGISSEAGRQLAQTLAG